MSEEAHSPRVANGLNRVAITISVPEPLLRRIDRFIKSRDVLVSRNNWLLEAAVEKLDRQQAPRVGQDGA